MCRIHSSSLTIYNTWFICFVQMGVLRCKVSHTVALKTHFTLVSCAHALHDRSTLIGIATRLPHVLSCHFLPLRCIATNPLSSFSASLNAASHSMQMLPFTAVDSVQLHLWASCAFTRPVLPSRAFSLSSPPPPPYALPSFIDIFVHLVCSYVYIMT